MTAEIIVASSSTPTSVPSTTDVRFLPRAPSPDDDDENPTRK
jgi:hypothetical protein